jgi:nicotinate-nucleotide adenylyltransferase
MRIVFYGGSFNPPHRGHLTSALAASEMLQPDAFLVIPDCRPPHKALEAGSPTPDERLELCRLNFASVPNVEVSDIEIARGGKSYTVDTVKALQMQYPDAELVMLVGTDMLLDLGRWYKAEYIMAYCVIAAFQRDDDDLAYIEAKADELRKRFRAQIEIIHATPLPAASSDIRELLRRRGGRELLTEDVYAYIVRKRLYGTKVNFDWLREKSYAMLKPSRIPHVRGCEEEAVRLARRWGADEEAAAEAAILHDCTKKAKREEQLALCEKYGVVPDAIEAASEKLMHAKTGAAIAETEFGCASEVVDAIRWHTTGRAEMSLLEQVIYMADYIEPNRDFEGVEPLRALAYEDLDKAMLLGLEMSLEDIAEQGNTVHENTLAACAYFQSIVKEKEKEERK